MIRVFFHDNCVDGSAAAALFKLRFPGAQLHACQYDRAEDVEAFRGCEHDEVYVVDFSFPRSICDEVFLKSKMVVLDHHASAVEKNELAGAEYFTYEPDKCGCLLAADFLRSFPGSSQRNQLLIQIDKHDRGIDLDQDLIRGLTSLPNDERLAALVRAFSDEGECVRHVQDWINRGAGAREVLEKIVAQQCEGAEPIVLWKQGFVLVHGAYATVNATSQHIFKTLGGGDPVAICTRQKDGRWKFSLRSTDKTARKTAEAFGGGGHDNAAGFTLLEADYKRLVAQGFLP